MLNSAPYNGLHRRIVLPSSSILASVKSTNVNEKLAQIVVPGNVKCSRIALWPHATVSINGVVNVESYSTLKKENKIKILCIRRPVIKRKTFCIGSKRLSQNLI